ncbi:class I SAM-dependent methyltransferase [Kineococcus sp. LSe6-4]|uniref:Class I SAM-dependent methyltransferase n=1 Tax=Kineococcus halophytocola TaxID=3234027 RepID=A0ABV4GVB3_9ACTN
MSSDRVQQAYSTMADVYLERLATMDVVHPDDRRVILRHLAGSDGPVLDLGCGPGHLTAFLHAAGCEVTGVDLVPEFIAHARRTHPQVPFVQGSLTGLDRPAGSVAGVLCWYSLIHQDPQELDGSLAEVRRVLAPGGAFVLGFFEGPVREEFDHRVTTAHRWPVDELSARLAVHGFTEVERLTRGQDGERRPHGVLAAAAG